jgi:hypothetical protein
MLLADALARESALGVFSAGSHGAWDTPYMISPAVERLSLWFEGLPTTGPAIAEAHCHTLSPMVLGSLLTLAPDPFLDPLASSADGILWGEEQEQQWETRPSSVRLTEGQNGASTEDAMLAREAGAWRAAGSYAHSHGEGRQLHPTGYQRYHGNRFQNLHLQLDRATAWGALRVCGSDRAGRYTLCGMDQAGRCSQYGSRKLVWESASVQAGVQLGRPGMHGLQVRLQRSNDRLQWWGGGVAGRRRTTSSTLRLHASSRRAGMGFLLSAGVDRSAFRVSGEAMQPGRWADTGMGIAIGVNASGPRTSAVATLGGADAWWGGWHLRGHGAICRELVRGLEVGVEGWTGAGAVFVPHLEPDAGALLWEGLHFAEGDRPAADGPVRRIWHGEVRGRLQLRGLRLSAALFARKVEGALGFDADAARFLRPQVREAIDLAGELGDLALLGSRWGGHLGLPLGASLAGDLSVLLDPVAGDLPTLTPPYRARGVLAVQGRLFKGDLRWEARLLCIAEGEWRTAEGRLPARARFDGELHGSFGRADFFFILQNLTDEFHESATYDEAWGSLPFRSSRAGVEWRFLD